MNNDEHTHHDVDGGASASVGASDSNRPAVDGAQRVWTLTSKRLREIGTVELLGLASGTLSIGCESADVLLDWPGVATRHVTLEESPAGLQLTAHAEKTWINDGPVAPGSERTVKPGDKITLGPIELHVAEEWIESDEPDDSPVAETSEWLERAQVQKELRRQLDEVELAAREQQRRLEEAEAAVNAAIDDVANEPGGRDVQEDIDQYRGLIDELKLSLVETTGEALEAHRQRLGDLKQRQVELDELHTRIRGRSDALSARERAIESREQSVEAAEQAVRDREQNLETMADELAEQGRQLDEREQAAWKRDRDLERREAELRRSETMWQTRLTEVQGQQLDLEKQQESAESLRSELDERASALDETEQQQIERSEQLDRREGELTKREEQCSSRESTLGEQRALLKSDRDAVDTERDRLASLREELDQRLDEFEQRTNELASEDARLSSTRVELDQDRERMRTEQRRREEQIVRQEAQLQERELAVRNRELAIEMSQEELAAGAASLGASTGSGDQSEWETRLAEAEEALQRREAELTEDEGLLDKERDELKALRETLEHERVDLEDREQSLAQRQAELEQTAAEAAVEQQRVQELFAKHEESAANDAEIESLEAMRADVEAMRAEIANEQAELASARDLVESDRDQLARERETYEASLQELEGSRGELESRTRELDESSAELETERESVERLKQELAEREQTLAASLEAHEAAAAEANEASDETASELDDLRATVAALTAELDSERANVETLTEALQQQSEVTTAGPAVMEPETEEPQSEAGLAAEWAAKLGSTSEEPEPPAAEADPFEPSETMPAGQFAHTANDTSFDEDVNNSDDLADDDRADVVAEASDDPFATSTAPEVSATPWDTPTVLGDEFQLQTASSSEATADDSDVAESSGDADVPNEAANEPTEGRDTAGMGDVLAAFGMTKEPSEEPKGDATTDIWGNAEPSLNSVDDLSEESGSSPEAAATFDAAFGSEESDPSADASSNPFASDDSPTDRSMRSDETDVDWQAEAAAASAPAESSDQVDDPSDAPLEADALAAESTEDIFGTEAAATESVAEADPFGDAAQAADDAFGAPAAASDPYADTLIETPKADDDDDLFAEGAETPSQDTIDDLWNTALRSEMEIPSASPDASSITEEPSSETGQNDASQDAQDPFDSAGSAAALTGGHSLTETSLFNSLLDSPSEPPVVPGDLAGTSEDAGGEQDMAVRSRLAEMFGVSVDDLSEAAERHPGDEEVGQPTIGDAAAPSEPNEVGLFDTSSMPAVPEPEPSDNDVSTEKATALGDGIDQIQSGLTDTVDQDSASPFDALYAAEAKEPKPDGFDSPVSFGSDATASDSTSGDDLPSFDDFAADTPQDLSAHATRQFDMPSDTPPEAKEEESEESVAAYMEQLLARSRGGAAAPAPAVVSPETPAATPSVETPVEPKAPRERQPIDADAIRKDISSFREVALISARTAVANSRVKQIRMQLIAKSVATGVGMIVSGVLIASPAWSKESFVSLGLIALAISCVIGFFTWESIKHYQRIMQVTKTKRDNDEPAPAEVEEDAAE